MLQVTSAQEVTQEATWKASNDPIVLVEPDVPPPVEYLTWQDIYIIVLVPIGAFFAMWVEKRNDKQMLTPDAVALVTESFVKAFNKLGNYVDETDNPIDDVVYDLSRIPLDMIKAEFYKRANVEPVEELPEKPAES